MAERPQVQKATIYKLRPNGSVDENAKVVCHFNPKDLAIVTFVQLKADLPKTAEKTNFSN